MSLRFCGWLRRDLILVRLLSGWFLVCILCIVIWLMCVLSCVCFCVLLLLFMWCVLGFFDGLFWPLCWMAVMGEGVFVVGL